MNTTPTNIVDKMRYVVQCFISDSTGRSVKVARYKSEQDFWALEFAYTKACEFYGDKLPCPDNGCYQDYVL